ncbi:MULTISPECIES: cupin domain-containing protein [Actinomadura]|uniref:Cupin domain-containing protein n=1 Tax=Actinomadura yumaensis TaxID=111807 RepID=A0ABW2CYL8_9ACTN|nr:cupin domain-containing protein [Actinomadura sp. J1-007]MWK37410.1 cupin domain-containing protein [Actinomadura sp. J1-007]
MTLIKNADSRRTETPNGVMTTLASPTQGGAGTALWRVDMAAGRQGPPHAFDTEQVWTCLEGGATVELDGAALTVAPGDTVVFPADAPRQVTADPEKGFVAVVSAPAGTEAYNPGGVSDPDACELAPKATERLVPLWAR